ncbi:MAG: sulfotransferase [Paracoccaceae bacterium]
MNFEQVFILSYGRSGSTLLQGLLNSIDGFLIRGENGNFGFYLYRAYNALASSPNQEKVSDVTDAWFGIELVDQSAVLDDMRNLVKNTILSDRINDDSVKCFGFKEVRYVTIGPKLDAYLDFLSDLFPNAGFLVLSRDLDQVAKSGWWAKRDPAWVKEHLGEFEDRINSYAEGRQNYFSLNYNDLIEMTDTLSDMFAFLGVDFVPEDVHKVLSKPHSYISKETK